MKKGLILINTGNGKGKTTAAFGMVLRAVGHGLKSEVIQFIKQRPTGEITALQKLAPELVEIQQHGNGFTWDSTDPQKDLNCAQSGWARAKEIIRSNCCAVLLLDEITYPINDKLIDINDVVETLQSKPEAMHIIVTGRNVAPELIEIADCVSEINPLKHHFDSNVPMQRIIEF